MKQVEPSISYLTLTNVVFESIDEQGRFLQCEYLTLTNVVFEFNKNFY